MSVACACRKETQASSAPGRGDASATSRSISAAPLSERGSLTFVLVKQHDGWLIALAQTTPIAD